MAIYTQLTPEDFAEIARVFHLGSFQSATLIPQGSINTNARLETQSGRYFIRHTTVRSAEELEFEAALLEHLHHARVPAPHMLRAGGSASYPLASGRVCAFRYLAGEELSRDALTVGHLERLGAELGRLHLATNSFLLQRSNPYAPQVVADWLAQLKTHSDKEVSSIAIELQRDLDQARQAESGLAPRGIIHADLFMDNVKWVGDQVSALFDFEMACRDEYVLDLAITLNAWCFQGAYHPELGRALVRGYAGVRALSEVEWAQLHPKLVWGAVRFTTSRIRDFHLSPLPVDKLARKDFRTYLARVRQLRELGPAGVRALLGG